MKTKRAHELKHFFEGELSKPTLILSEASVGFQKSDAYKGT